MEQVIPTHHSRSTTETLDTGALCLALVAQINQVAIDVRQIKHQFGKPGETLTDTELLRAAKSIGYKARATHLTSQQLVTTALPVIGKLNAGGYFLIAKTATAQTEEDQQLKVLIHNPVEARPRSLTVEELESIWTGEVILLSRRGTCWTGTPARARAVPAGMRPLRGALGAGAAGR